MGIGHTGYAYKLPRPHRHQLLLIQTRASSLDAVQILVDLVRAIERHVQQDVVGEAIEGDGGEAVFENILPGLIAGGDEADAGGVVVERDDGFEHVDDGGAAADADVGG